MHCDLGGRDVRGKEASLQHTPQVSTVREGADFVAATEAVEQILEARTLA